jgi:flavin reductase (DIM6/NTAB) family NADH-FMN oxidoreductase RutF
MIWESGCFAMHLLQRDQWQVIWQLGFFSGRERDKLAGLPYRLGRTGCPILAEAYAWFDCRVINVMDNGSSTCFLGDVVEAGRGPGEACMTSEYFRAHMPREWLPLYQEQLVQSQAFAARYGREVKQVVWQRP